MSCPYSSDYDWKWDPTTLSSSVCLTRGNKEVLFHPDYSCGTAAAKGSEPLCQGGEYYWEIKMTSAVYGTDMVGHVLYFCSGTIWARHITTSGRLDKELEMATDDLIMICQYWLPTRTEYIILYLLDSNYTKDISIIIETCNKHELPMESCIS